MFLNANTNSDQAQQQQNIMEARRNEAAEELRQRQAHIQALFENFGNLGF